MVAALGGEMESFVRQVAELQWGLMITVFCVLHVPALLTIESRLPGKGA